MKNESKAFGVPSQSEAVLAAPNSGCLYAILGIPSRSTQRDIDLAYKGLNMRYHPDKQAGNSDDEKAKAAENLKKVQVAYSVLKDEQKRAEYDAAAHPHPYQPALRPVFVDPPTQEALESELPENLKALVATHFEEFNLDSQSLGERQGYGIKIVLGEMRAAWNWATYHHLVDDREFKNSDCFLIYWLYSTPEPSLPIPHDFLYDNSQVQLDNIWRNSLGLRALAWVNIIQSVHAYRDSTLTETALRVHVRFISNEIRNGQKYFKDFYTYLYLPILQSKSRLEGVQEIRETKGKGSSAECDEKISQLDLVLNDVRKVLHEGVREFIALHKEQVSKNGQKDEAKLFEKRQEIFQKAADKIREYENKKEIGQARNKISRVLKAILLAIPAALLALPCVFTKTGRRAWMGLFYYNRTEQTLKKARRKLLKAKSPSIAA